MSVTSKKDIGGKSEEILEAALKIFTEVGYHNARIADIAEGAGIGKGTLYLYFPGKKELFLALLKKIARSHIDIVSEALKRADSLQAKLKIIAKGHLTLFKSRRDLAWLNVHETIMQDPAFQKVLLEFRSRYMELVVSILAGSRSALETAGGRCDQVSTNGSAKNLREAAIAFIGLVNGFNIEMVIGRGDPDLSALSERIADLFLNGFANSVRYT